MLEEEKKAIEKLNKILDYCKKEELNNYENIIRTILNIVNELKKENKELQEENISLFKDLNDWENLNYQKNERLLEANRQIDLMAEKINEAYCEEGKFWLWFEEKFGIVPKGNYKNRIIQYFEEQSKTNK